MLKSNNLKTAINGAVMRLLLEIIWKIFNILTLFQADYTQKKPALLSPPCWPPGGREVPFFSSSFMLKKAGCHRRKSLTASPPAA
jgi:hypothetical protein